MNKPTLLIVAGGVITLIGIAVNRMVPWSGISGLAIPWLCSALGLSLVLCAVHVCVGGHRRMKDHWLLYAIVVAIAAIGVFVDWLAYRDAVLGSAGLLINELEVFGWGVVYAAVLKFTLTAPPAPPPR